MPTTINVDAEIDGIRLAEQASDPGAVDAGYFHAYMKETGLYWIDDNEIIAGPLGTSFTPTGRLTLTTATPVTTADVTGATTVYYTPYKGGNLIPLWDGARRIPVTYTEKSLTMVGATASKPYDFFGYLSSGTLALEKLVWTDGTTRATDLAYSPDGWLSKSGDATRLYLGTVYCNSSGGQTDDSDAKRFVWNYYNRVSKRLFSSEATSHTYATATFRLWNNSATNNSREFIVGVAEDNTTVSINVTAAAPDTGRPWFVGIAYDSTSATVLTYARVSTAIVTATEVGTTITHLPTAGYHYYAVVEYATAGANATLLAQNLFVQIMV